MSNQKDNADFIQLIETKLIKNKIGVKKKRIYISNNSIVGIKTYGYIDCLRNHFSYIVEDVRDFKAQYYGIYC